MKIRQFRHFILFFALCSFPATAFAVTSKISANYGAGAMIVGPNSNTCNAGLAGAIRFTSGSPGILAYCDSVTSAWVQLGGGGITPAGANTQIQFNSGGSALGASSNFTYDLTNNIMSVANSGTGSVRPGVGMVSTPSHGFSSSVSTGMYTISPGWNLNFAVGGIQAMQMDYTASAINYMKLTPGTTGNPPTITNIGSATNGVSLGLTFNGKLNATPDENGGGVFVTGGAGNGTGAGGALTFTAGTAGATGAGGAINITGGTSGILSGNGGAVSIGTGTVTSGTMGSILAKLGATTYMTVQPPGTANASVVFNGTDAMTVPIGNTAARPSIPVNGMIRYNTTTTKFEAVQAGGWTNVLPTAATAIDGFSDAITNYTGTASTSTNSTYSMFLGQGVGVTAQVGAAYNTAMGVGAMQALTTGTDNTAFGYMALAANTSGSRNTAMGALALANNTTGNDNSAAGYRALTSNTTGSRNSAAGANALAANTIGTDNTAVGYNALASNISGSYNSAMGSYAMASLVTGSYNTAAGYMAMASGTGSYNTFVGSAAGQGVGGDYNTGVGANALGSTSFTGSYNTAVGSGAGQSVTTGTNNVFIGKLAGSNVTTGSNNILIGQGINASSATVSNELNIGGVFQGVLGGSNYVRFDSADHFNYKGSAPAVSACGTATIAGNDNQFVVTRTVASGACTITFANTWTNVPHCIVSGAVNLGTTGRLYVSAASTSAITITHSGTSTGKLYVMCRGYL